MSKRIKWSLFFSILLLIIIMLCTRPGIHAAYWLTKKILPGELTIETLSGTNIAHLNAKNIYYHTDTQDINLETLVLDWKPLRLLTGQLHIQNLTASKIRVKELKASESKFSWSQLRDIKLQAIQLNDIQWTDLNAVSHQITYIKMKSNQENGSLNLNELAIKGKHFLLTGFGEINQKLAEPISFKMQLEIERFKKKIQGHAVAQGRWDNIVFEAALNPPFATKVKGTLNLSTHSPRINVEANWNLLSWPLTDNPLIELKQGNLHIDGPLENYKLNFTSELHTKHLPESIISGHGQGHLRALEIEKFRIKTLSGEMHGDAKCELDPFIWSMHLYGKKINPGKFWDGYEGNINFSLSGQGEENKSHVLNLEKLKGQLNQHPLDGHGKFTLAKQAMNFKDLRIILGGSHIRLDGGYDKHWNIAWHINIPNISQFDRNAKGKISSQGQWKEKSLASTTEITELSFHDLNLSKLKLLTRGTPSQHEIELNYQHEDDKGQIKLTGQYHQGWHGRLQQAKLSVHGHQWQLLKPIAIDYQAPQFKIEKACWHIDKQPLCIAADYHDQSQWNFLFTTEQLATRALPWFNEHVKLDSRLNINLHASRKNQQVSLDLKSQLLGGHVDYLFEDEAHREEIKFIKLNALIKPSGLQANLNGELARNKTVVGELDLPDYKGNTLPQMNQGLRGFLKVHFPDLQFIAPLIPQVQKLTGVATLNLDLSGHVGEPKLEGQLRIQNANANLPLLGVELKNIFAEFRGQGNNQVVYDARANSGKGRVDIHGKATFSQKRVYTQTDIKGEQFDLIHTDDYEIEINPNLHCVSDGRAIKFTGSIDIPKAKIAPRDFSQTVELPRDVVYVNEAKVEPLPYKLSSELNLNLGKNVEIDVLGIRGKLGGNLKILDDPQTPTTANGEIKIRDGKYEAYGRSMDIKRGILIFTGGRIDNPGLNVQAERQIISQDSSSFLSSFSEQHFSNRIQNTTFTQQTNRITVGVNIGGTLEKPDVKLYSSPIQLPDAEILSYLVLNRSTAQMSNSSTPDHHTLLNAIPALSLSSDTASRLTHELQHTLGLDQIEITGTGDPLAPNNLANTSISIGKAISDRLYVSYSYGLLNAKNALRIRYLLSRRWTIQTEAITDANSTAKSVDFIYSISK